MYVLWSFIETIRNSYQDEQQQVLEKLNEYWSSFGKVTRVADKLFLKSTTIADPSTSLKECIEKVSSTLQRCTLLQDDIGFVLKHRKGKDSAAITLGKAQGMVEAAASLMKDIMEYTKVLRVLMPKDS